MSESRFRSGGSPKVEFTEWLEIHQFNLVKSARAVCFDQQNVDDVLQETLADIYKRWKDIRDHDNLEAYAVRVMVSKHADLRRKWARRQVERETTLEFADFISEIADDTDELSERLLVQAALKSLTAAQRAVLLLSYQYGYPIREVSEILGMPVGTVASHLARGKNAIALYVAPRSSVKYQEKVELENNSQQPAQNIQDAEVIEE
ncbi:MAG: sigma-70 family RNA polymerase sigma factor [Actinomycetes bacterium]|jgi:RNA polymerase sigma factor (sigma-70 family)